MNLRMRSYKDEDDFWRMRAFLRDVFLLNDRLERSWSTPRLDYWRWHFIKNCGALPLEQSTFIWETKDRQLAALLHPIWKGEAFLQVHPHFHSIELENAMLAIAEEQLASVNAAGYHHLVTLVDEDDLGRKQVLQERGYIQQKSLVFHWMRDLETPQPEVIVPPGYRICSMGDAKYYDARAWASWRAFHPEDPAEDFEGGKWYANIQAAPLYRRDLDIIAEASTGEVAAFCTIWYDDFTRSAVCVLVGTDPAHQRRGLGKAVMIEGLRRLKYMGGTRVFANGYDPAANALYNSILGTSYRTESWLKKI